MKSFDSTIKIPTAINARNRFNLSCDHYTTNDFFRLKPVYIHEMVPSEEISIDMHTISRTMALRKPFYGTVEFVNRAFFVPCRTIMNNWNEFIVDTTSGGSGNKKNYVPYFTNADLKQMFKEVTGLVTLKTVTVADEKVDLQIITGAGSTTTSYQFTTKGKIFYDILRNLGYHINFSMADSDDSDKMSALPLLAFYRLYNDWLKNPAYASNSDNQLKYDGEKHFTYSEIGSMLNRVMNGLYEKDYFTSAWQKPTGPNSSNTISAINFPDITNDSTGSTSITRSLPEPSGNYPSTPTISSTNNGQTASSAPPISLSQYALTRLKQLTDYVKRFQLVGERALDRYKALFGITLDSAKLERSEYLGHSNMTMQVGEVMITANTQDGVAGDYTGRSAGYAKGSFHYKTDEYGYLIIVSMVRPHVGYYQGRPRMINHVNRLDFFNPQFDGVGTQPIRMDEVYSDSFLDGQQLMGHTNDVFGWSSTYAEYKCALDNVSGDFMVNSLNTNLEAFHLMRMIDPQNIDDGVTENFTIGTNKQFDRIFALTDGKVDQFITVYHFDVSSWLPMKPLFEDYSFDEGKLVTESIGGTQLN